MKLVKHRNDEEAAPNRADLNKFFYDNGKAWTPESKETMLRNHRLHMLPTGKWRRAAIMDAQQLPSSTSLTS